MTVGQRIMQKRKELSFSQEALGERLGVSRQAIYKWESDSSLPEIEKLVALSKIFSVTVGWLLGVEEENAGAAECSAGGELTESQIQMVEEIVSRYQASIPQGEEPKKHRRWPYAVTGAVIVAMAVSLLHINGRLENLQSSYNALQNSVGYIDRQVGDRISSITMQVENVLNRVNSFTIEQGSEIEAVDLEAGTVTFSVYAVPKTFVNGMTARFTAVCGGHTEQAEGVLGDQQDFSGILTMPLTNEPVELSVTFTSGGKQELQPVNTYRELYNCSFPSVSMTPYPLFFDVRNDVLDEEHWFDLSVNAEPIGDGMVISQVEPDDIRMGLFADGKLVRWMVPTEPAEGNGNTLYFRNPKPIRLDRSKIYTMAAVVLDHYGRERVVPGTPISYSEQEQDWSFAQTDDGQMPLPDRWEY